MWFALIGIIIAAGLLFSGDESSRTQQTNEASFLQSLEELPESTSDGDSSTSWYSPLNFGGFLNYSEEENREEIEAKRQEVKDLQSSVEDLNWEMNRLRRNVDSYDADEFSSRLKRLQWEAEDLSSQAGDLDADDAASSLDDSTYRLRRLRSEIESEESYFYREREDEIYSGLKRIEWGTEDASSFLEDLSSELGEDF